MKKLLAIFLCLAMVCSFAACTEMESEPIETVDPQQEYADMLARQKEGKPYVTKAEVYMDAEDGEIYLTADIKNVTDVDIKEFVLAFAVWDAAGEPIIIKSASGETKDQFVKKCTFSEPVAAGADWVGCIDETGNLCGLLVDSSLENIVTVKAALYSYTDENGETVMNPDYYSWENLHFYEPLKDYMMDSVA